MSVCPSVRPVSTFTEPYGSETAGPRSMKLSVCILGMGTQLFGSGLVNFGPCASRATPNLVPIAVLIFIAHY